VSVDSEGTSSVNTSTSNVSATGSTEQSSWTRVRHQVIDMLQTIMKLPATAPITDQVLLNRVNSNNNINNNNNNGQGQKNNYRALLEHTH